MCTAISYLADHHYFGRNLDLEYSLAERVTISPRNVPFPFRCLPTLFRHHAIIGIAHISDHYPLYYEATNECGLSMAGLHFPGNAPYAPVVSGRYNVAPFELIPWLLGQCSNVEQALPLLEKANLVDINFSASLPSTPLHWLLSDRSQSVVLEPTEQGLQIFQNGTGVLTNNPPFPAQLAQLSRFSHLSPHEPAPSFVPLPPDSRGTGAMGLPGDSSSPSRFVRAVFSRFYSCSGQLPSAPISQFFHLLDNVAMIRGCVRLEQGALEFTRYSSCCDTDTGIFYYTTYDNRQISAVCLHNENLDHHTLISYPLLSHQNIHMQN